MTKMIDWEDAIDEAKEELGISGYTKNWNEVVERAKEILEEKREEDFEDERETMRLNHREYLKSDYWKKLRLEILFRDNFLCKDCKSKATDVHHLNYDFVKTQHEKEYCISLCRKCHDKRHM